MNLEQITQQILEALVELNQQLPPEGRIDPSQDAALLAPDGKLDSLGLVNLILLVEERVSSDPATKISLTDDRTMAQAQSVFRDVPSLAHHILELVNHPKHDAGATA